MIKYILLACAYINVVQEVSTHSSSSFQELVCQQCRFWCELGEDSHVISKVGKSGPRRFPGPRGPVGAVVRRGGIGPKGEAEPAGPRGPPGIINLTAIEEMIDSKLNYALTVQSCTQVQHSQVKRRNTNSGVFNIHPIGLGQISVYCDTETDGGGWTVFQRRIDGSVDFYRDWTDYVNGFGNKTRDFWLGLEKIHQLTKRGDYELRIDMTKTDGTRVYVKYGSFSVGPASDGYRISISGYSGNIADKLSGHNKQQFSTHDADHDSYRDNCALMCKGGWWYNQCYYNNINGIFGRRDNQGIRWSQHSENYMEFTEMKFREK